MTTESQQIRAWYQSIKQHSTCLCNKRNELPAQYGQVEFHHLDKDAKCDTLSSMVIKPLIPCLKYTVQPVTFALELMKVVPLTPDNHKALHQAEDRGDVMTLQTKFDFVHDPFYQGEVAAFRLMALDLAPQPIMEQVREGLFDLLESGRVIFDKQSGFVLA